MHAGKIIVVSLFTSLLVASGAFFAFRAAVGPSNTSKMVGVPSLAGVTLDQARELVEAKDLRLAVFERRPNALDAGKIIKQVPAAKSTVRAGTVTYVIVSEGPKGLTAPKTAAPKAAAAAPKKAPPAPPPAPPQVEVPKLVWRKARSAQKTLEEAGLQLGKRRFRSDEDRAPGIVLRQNPKPGEKVAKGSSVDIWVNETE